MFAKACLGLVLDAERDNVIIEDESPMHPAELKGEAQDRQEEEYQEGIGDDIPDQINGFLED